MLMATTQKKISITLDAEVLDEEPESSPTGT